MAMRSSTSTRKGPRLAAWLLGAFLTCSALADEGAKEPVTIQKVLSAKLEMSKGALRVTAVGEVPTGGYTQATLMRVTYVKQPADGYQDYVLRAVPPEGVATQVISQVEASDTWSAVPGWVKGVRIRGVGDGVLEKALKPN